MRRSFLIPCALAAFAAPAMLTASWAKPAAQPALAPSAAPSTAPSPTPEEQRAAINAEQARIAQQQVDENVARELNNRDNAIDAIQRQRDYVAARAAYEAQLAKYQADLVKWKADVAACQAGDRTRCAQR